jgi:hypothetical protein
MKIDFMKNNFCKNTKKQALLGQFSKLGIQGDFNKY